MIQLQALNYILDTKDSSFLVLNNLTKDYFSDYINEFQFIQNHLEQYNTIPDKATFLSKFPKFDIIEVTESVNYLFDGLVEDNNKRLLAKTFNKVRELITSGKVDEAMRVYANASDDMVKAKHLTCVDLINDTSRYTDFVNKCSDFSTFYVKTGFDELDEIIGGWDRSEELGTIVARPGVGKSWVLLKVAVAAAMQGLNVGIYSGEMSENKVGYRMDTLIGHISKMSIMRGNSGILNDYKQYIDTLKDKIKGSIKVITPAMINGLAGVTALRAFIEKENLDMLCVDQHSLLEDDRKGKSAVEKASNISKDLKRLQVLKKIPIISVSQQNRTSTEEGVDTSHIAQSDRIAQDSTVVIFLEQKDGILTLSLVKSRDSVNNKKLCYAYDFDKGVFQYMPTQEDGLEGKDCESLREEFESIHYSAEDVF